MRVINLDLASRGHFAVAVPVPVAGVLLDKLDDAVVAVAFAHHLLFIKVHL